jgi:hypothetical protein
MIDGVLPNVGKIYVLDENQSAPLPLLNLGDSPLSTPAKR